MFKKNGLQINIKIFIFSSIYVKKMKIKSVITTKTSEGYRGCLGRCCFSGSFTNMIFLIVLNQPEQWLLQLPKPEEHAMQYIDHAGLQFLVFRSYFCKS